MFDIYPPDELDLMALALKLTVDWGNMARDIGNH